MATAATLPDRPLERVPIGKLKPYERNARTHSEAQIAQIAASIREFGFTNPLLADEKGRVIAGHGRLAAAALLGLADVPVIRVTGLSDQQRRALVLADNQLAMNAGWDEALLADELSKLSDDGFDLGIIGFDPAYLDQLLNPPGDNGGSRTLGSMSAEFLIPPFSVLNSREGWWQDRKRQWLSLGIRSEIGRVEDDHKTSAERSTVPAGLTFGEIPNYGGSARSVAGTSIFDPVMCELAYRWFCPAGGVVLDPFAGGSVRGIVAAKLGRPYVGIDLRAEQCDANREQAATILADGDGAAEWIEGDSSLVLPGMDCSPDFILSSPPYGDLEQYSDDPRDLSNMEVADFLSAYRRIVQLAVERLKPDRFACFVVGDYRGSGRGFYRNFVGETVAAFEAAGAGLYNEAVLVTAIGSLPIRAGRSFRSTRKLGKTHQNVLVFCKGDPRKAVEACGEVDIEGALRGLQTEDDGDPNAGFVLE